MDQLNYRVLKKGVFIVRWGLVTRVCEDLFLVSFLTCSVSPLHHHPSRHHFLLSDVDLIISDYGN